MSQSDQFDKFNQENEAGRTLSDPYTSESSADIYSTPDLSGGLTSETPVERIQEADIIVEDMHDGTVSEEQAVPEGSFAGSSEPYDAVTGEAAPQEMFFQESGDAAYGSQQVQVENPYVNSPYGNNPYGGQSGSSYENNYNNGQSMQNGSSYGGNSYGNGGNMQNVNPYGLSTYSGPTAQNNNQNPNPGGSRYYSAPPVKNENPYANNTAYGSNVYGAQNAQNGNPYDHNPYGGQPVSGSNMYGNQYGSQTAQNGGAYTNQYGGGAQGNGGYGGNGNPPYGNNQYSPYAMPPKKNNTGLIIGIVIAVIVLFIVALGALAYKVVALYAEEDKTKNKTREEYNFDDDDWDNDRNGRNHDDYDHDYDDHDYDYDYDDWFDDDDDWLYDDDYDYDSEQYYTLHDDIKKDLSYSVEFESFEYDTKYDNVDILVSYPVIKGADVPNLDKLNRTIQEEIDFFTEYFEEDYEEYLTDDDYFDALSAGYVTYMDEEKLSIVFNETVYSGHFNDVYLHCINIDMENGVILDNENILNLDDDFSVEFRQKSDTQNGEISSLTMMSDQEMTKYFNSSDVIVFYTPKGMEIGFNYEEGWVTVTYEEYEKYMKVF